MKEIIIKNKKISSVVLGAIAILFFVLTIANLQSTKRNAYQTMYDANYELYSSYIEYAERYEELGYSSKAQELYSKAHSTKEDVARYKKDLTGLNIQAAVFVVLAVGAIGGIVFIFKTKDRTVSSEEEQNPENVTVNEVNI